MAAIYVGNLHAEVTEALLLHTFSSAGKVQSVRICRDRKSGSSRGYAYVNFQRRADAERALDMFNFELLLGKPIRVMWSNYETRVRFSKRGNIFLKNLDPSIDKLALSDAFSIFGRIMSCKVVSKDSGSPGHGYIQFETEESAESAIEQLNGKLLNKYQVTIEHFKSHKQRQAELHKKWEEERMQEYESTYLCIKNLDESIDEKDLYLAFSNFGTITKAKVIMMNGHSLGFGFVCFSSAKEAMIARRNTNGRMWGKKPVHIVVAISGGESQAQLALQLMQPPSLPDNTISEVETCLNSVPAVQPVQSVDIVPVKTAPSLNSIPAPAPTLDTVSDTETSPAVDLNSAEVQSAHIPETTQAPEVDESLSSRTSSNEMQLDTKRTYLCIKNLDESIDEKDLYLAFSNFGTITKAKVIMMNGHSLGFGIVCFSSAKEAMIARRNMNGRMWGKKPVHIVVAISGGESQAQLALQLMQPPSLPDNTISEVETCLNSVPAVQPVQSVDIVPVKTAPSLNSIPAPAPTLDTVSDTETSPAVDLNSAEVQS